MDKVKTKIFLDREKIHFTNFCIKEKYLIQICEFVHRTNVWKTYSVSQLSCWYESKQNKQDWNNLFNSEYAGKIYIPGALTFLSKKFNGTLKKYRILTKMNTKFSYFRSGHSIFWVLNRLLTKYFNLTKVSYLGLLNEIIKYFKLN